MQETDTTCLSISDAMQKLENGNTDAIPVCGQNGETLAWLVPAAKYIEMVERLEELKDVVMIPLLTTEEILKQSGDD